MGLGTTNKNQRPPSSPSIKGIGGGHNGKEVHSPTAAGSSIDPLTGKASTHRDTHMQA